MKQFFTFTTFFLLLTSTLFAGYITDKWESSKEYSLYLEAMKERDLSKALKIKKTLINTITREYLTEYINDFKPKYREKYTAKFLEYPIELRELTATIHKHLSPKKKENSQKAKNKFARAIYDFINHTYKEDGKALKYAIIMLAMNNNLNTTKLLGNLWKTSLYILWRHC